MSRSRAEFLPRITMNTQAIEPQELKTTGVFVEKKTTNSPEELSSDVLSNQPVPCPLRSILSPGRRHSLSSELGSLSKSILETQSPKSVKTTGKNKTKSMQKKKKKEQYVAEEWITLPNAPQYSPRSRVLKKREKKHFVEEWVKKEHISKKKPTYKTTSKSLNNQIDNEESNGDYFLKPHQPQLSKPNKRESPPPPRKTKRNLKSDSFLTRRVSPLPKTSKQSKKTSLFLKSVNNTTKTVEKKVEGFVDPEKFFHALKVLAKKKRQYHHMEIVIPGSGDERRKGKKSADYLAYQAKLRSGVLLPKSRRKQFGSNPKTRTCKPVKKLRESSFSPFNTGTPVTAVEYYSKRSTP